MKVLVIHDDGSHVDVTAAVKMVYDNMQAFMWQASGGLDTEELELYVHLARAIEAEDVLDQEAELRASRAGYHPEPHHFEPDREGPNARCMTCGGALEVIVWFSSLHQIAHLRKDGSPPVVLPPIDLRWPDQRQLYWELDRGQDPADLENAVAVDWDVRPAREEVDHCFPLPLATWEESVADGRATLTVITSGWLPVSKHYKGRAVGAGDIMVYVTEDQD